MIPTTTRVRMNWASYAMPWAEMGGGNHHVLATKKYAITTVSTQITGASSIPALLYEVRYPSTRFSKVKLTLSQSMKEVQLGIRKRGWDSGLGVDGRESARPSQPHPRSSAFICG